MSKVKYLHRVQSLLLYQVTWDRLDGGWQVNHFDIIHLLTE